MASASEFLTSAAAQIDPHLSNTELAWIDPCMKNQARKRDNQKLPCRITHQ